MNRQNIGLFHGFKKDDKIVTTICKVSDNEKKGLSAGTAALSLRKSVIRLYFCHNANILKGSRHIDCIAHTKVKRYK